MGAVSLPAQFSDYLMPYAHSRDSNLEMSNDFPRIDTGENEDNEVFGCNGNRVTCPSSGRSYSSPVLRRKNTNSSEKLDSQSSTPRSGSRRVSFADEVGQDLVLVRIFSADSIKPVSHHKGTPRKALSLDMRPSFCALPSAFAPKLAFDQPSANFKTFMQQLQQKCVALDNIIVTQKSMFGTIKVKNICFAKEVFVRCTFDRWASYTDIKAEYVPCCTSETTINPYDTFLFDTTLSKGECVYHSIEFAACMRADDHEYWDNNNSKNYTVLFDFWLSENKNNVHKRQSDTNFESWREEITQHDNAVCSPPPSTIGRMRRNFCLY